MLPAAFLQPSQFRVEIGGEEGGMCFMEDELQQAWHKTFAPVLPAIHRPLPFLSSERHHAPPWPTEQGLKKGRQKLPALVPSLPCPTHMQI